MNKRRGRNGKQMNVLMNGMTVAGGIMAVLVAVAMLAGVALLFLSVCPRALTTEPNLRQTNSAYNDLAFEDLMDMLERVEPAETPMYSMATRETELGNTQFDWEVDSWPTPKGAEGPGDGYALQTTEVRDVTTSKRKMGNIGQLFRRGYGSGLIANAVPKLPGVGRGKLVAAGAADAMVLLKQDAECAFCSFDQTAVQDVGSSSGSTMAGMRKLIDPANAYAAASAFTWGKATDLHGAAAGACVTGTLASAWNLSAVRGIAKALRNVTKRNGDYAFLMGVDLREAVTGLVDPGTASATGGALAATTVRMYSQSLADKELGISIDVIRTDWGRLMVIPTSLIGNTTTDANGSAQNDANRTSRVFVEKPKYGLIFKRGRTFKRIGIPFKTEDIARDGGGIKQMAYTYQSLGVYNPQECGFCLFT